MGKLVAIAGFALLLHACSTSGYSDATDALTDLVVCLDEPLPADELDSSICHTDEGAAGVNIADNQEEAEELIADLLDNESGRLAWDLGRVVVMAPTESRAEAIAEKLDGRVIRSLSDLRS